MGSNNDQEVLKQQLLNHERWNGTLDAKSDFCVVEWLDLVIHTALELFSFFLLIYNSIAIWCKKTFKLCYMVHVWLQIIVLWMFYQLSCWIDIQYFASFVGDRTIFNSEIYCLENHLSIWWFRFNIAFHHVRPQEGYLLIRKHIFIR